LFVFTGFLYGAGKRISRFYAGFPTLLTFDHAACRGPACKGSIAPRRTHVDAVYLITFAFFLSLTWGLAHFCDDLLQGEPA